jgi:hypothetical protein
MKALSILPILLLVACVASQEIVDYSHTASIQKTQLNSNKKYEISISAGKLSEHLLDFPAACTRNRDLLTNEIVERDRAPLGNQEEFLGKLKANMTAFLRLAERIKTQRTYLAGKPPPMQSRPRNSLPRQKATPWNTNHWKS